MAAVYINGKFLAQETTGVQRVARSLLQAIDRLQQPTERAWTLLHPAGVKLPPLQNVRLEAVGPRGLPLHLWEQTCLPWAARQGLLLNLAGSAPAAARRQLCLVHDAAVFDCPGTYTTTFATWYQALFSFLAWRKVTFLTVSEFSRSRLMRHLGLVAADIQLLGNGSDHLDEVDAADEGLLERLDLLGQPFLLMVGSETPGKNLARLLQAVAALPASVPGVLVKVGGRNTAVFRAPQQSADCTASRVHAVGVVTDAELKLLYLRATALVIPSLYEGFGLPAAEAMRLGCPVVASTAGALPEVCGDAALAVDPLAISELTEALVRVLTDEPLRRRLSLAGQERMAGVTWRAAGAKLQAIVQQAART